MRFIIHDGEVYCRYSDVYEEGQEEVIVEEEMEDEPTPLPKKQGKSQSKKRRLVCGLCGEEGHMKKTCTNPPLGPDFDAGKDTAYGAARTRAAGVIETTKSLVDQVRDLFESGCSLDEVILAFPSEPTGKISGIYREVSNAGNED